MRRRSTASLIGSLLLLAFAGPAAAMTPVESLPASTAAGRLLAALDRSYRPPGPIPLRI